MFPDHANPRTGLLLGIGAYFLWGLLPLYLWLLRGVPALQVLAHRVIWSLLLLCIIVVALRQTAAIRAAARGKTLWLLAVSAMLIAINWLVYIWSVQHGHVIEASLGYFINPLVNVAIGVAVLGERIRRWQGIAVAIAAAGVVLMAFGSGALWISLTLALTFGIYGLIRKTVAIDALGGLTVETLLLAPICLAIIVQAGATGQSAFGASPAIDALLILAGAVTAAPLLMFAAAARRMRYSTMGLLQYIGPTLQLLQAVLLFGEVVRPAQIAIFALIWTGCALYAWDSLRAGREVSVRPSGR